MENAKAQNSSRKSLLKKAAVLATVASITGAVGVGSQKPKESEAIIGAIIGIVSTLVSVGAGIGTTVADSVAQSNAKKQAEEEARRQAEEARRQAEEEARRQALQTGEHNIRVKQEQEKLAEANSAKEINMSVADNSELSAQQQAASVSRFNTGLSKPVNPPKNVHVGGFGVAAEETKPEQKVENVTKHEAVVVQTQSANANNVVQNTQQQQQSQQQSNVVENTQQNVQQQQNNVVENTNDTITQEVINESLNTVENTNENFENTTVVENNKNTDDKQYTEIVTQDKIESNIVRFPIKDLEIEESLAELGSEDIVAQGFGIVGEYSEKDYVEVDESDLMTDEMAAEHRLVQDGSLTSDDLILLDFGIRNGSITQDLLDLMYESQEITQEYYEAATSLMSEMIENGQANNNSSIINNH